MARSFSTGAALLALLGCVPVSAPGRADLGIELVRSTQPPKGAADACWARSTTPAVIETTTEQVQLSPEIRNADGSLRTPATYRTQTRQRLLQDREEVWFRAPCPEEFTADYVATLQRALKARGLYLLPLTGLLDAPTNEAIRRFQAARGLDSPLLSLAAAQELGVSSTRLDQL